MLLIPESFQALLPILNTLSWVRIRISLQARSGGKLPIFLGSALRGEIGPRLDNILGGKTHKSTNPAMTIDVRLLKNREIKEKNKLTWGLMLIGDFRLKMEDIIYSLSHDYNLGERRIPFSVKSITLNPPVCFRPNKQSMEIVPRLERGDRFLLRQNKFQIPSIAEIQLLTPLRLIRNGTLLRSFEPEVFFCRLRDRLMRYIPSECRQENDQFLRSPDFSKVKLITGGDNWFELKCLSYSQKKKIWMSGLIGRIRFGPLTPELWALLRLGEVFHVGEKTAYGLGRYQILNGSMPHNF